MSKSAKVVLVICHIMGGAYRGCRVERPGPERMNGRSAHERGVFGEVAALPGPNPSTKILAFSDASTTKHARSLCGELWIHVTYRQ